MVGVEHPARRGDVDLAGTERAPRQLDKHVEVRPHHRVFSGRLGHALQTLQLLAGVLLHLFRHLRLGNSLRQFVDLGGLFVLLAELLLDRAQLLPEDVLALLLVHRFFGLLANLRGEAHHLDAVIQKGKDGIEPRLHIEGLEDLLLFGGF